MIFLSFQLMEVTLSGLHGACAQGLVEVDPTPEQDLVQHQLLTVWDKLASNKVWDQQAKQSYATHRIVQVSDEKYYMFVYYFI